MIKKTLLFSAFCFFTFLLSAKNFTVSGLITDSGTGETLIGASVFDSNSKKGTSSNAYGFYSLTLPEGAVKLIFSYVGYEKIEKIFTLSKDTAINISFLQSKELETVLVYGNRNEIGVQGTQMSAIEVSLDKIKTVPALFGEVDVIKALQLLPGVQSGTEGSAGFYVRGGGPDENLILLDEIPVYNVNHAMGFFSVFNADALKSVTLYKGSFPARFGERLSSVIDVRMNDGNRSGYHGNASIGLISSKFNLEGPIGKKTTFSLSGRRTYFDILTEPIIAWQARENGQEGTTGGYYFYDLNAKVSHILTDRDRLYLSFYMGDDVVYARVNQSNRTYEYDERDPIYQHSTHHTITERHYLNMDWKWGNLITALRWNHIINNKLFMNTTAAYTRYRFFVDMKMEQQSIDNGAANNTDFSLGYHSGIEDFLFKTDFDYKLSPAHDIKFGMNFTSHSFRPDVIALQGNSGGRDVDFSVHNDPIPAQEIAIYAEDNVSLTDIFKVNFGLRYSGFYVQNHFYNDLQPRLSLRALINERLSVKAGYAYMSQYIHLLSNSDISMPTDLWVPSTARITPMNAHQVAAGAFYNLLDIVDLSAEIYYKTMNNILEYKDGASFFGLSTGWEDKVNAGRGWSYGLELLAQKTVGKTTGWIGYTWSKSERLFERTGQEINFGKVFPAKFDRRHDFNITVTHKFSEKIDLSATWIFSTGNAGTLALQNYQSLNIPNADGLMLQSTATIPYYESRNNYRLPNYHRLDLGVNFHKKKKHGVRTWNISIFNVYNQLNPFLVYEGSHSGKKSLMKVSLFPIIPSMSYIYKF